MNNSSVFRDYYARYKNITFGLKAWIFIKAFVLPAYPESKICAWLRLGEKAKDHGNWMARRIIERKIYSKFNCQISTSAILGEGLWLPHPMNIVIGNGCKIGRSNIIYQGVTIGQSRGGYPSIGDNVIIYPGAVICGRIHVGDNVVIGANSVVVHDVQDNCVVSGNPAVEIKKLDVESIREYY